MKYFGKTVTRKMQLEHFASNNPDVPDYAVEPVFNAITLSRGPEVNIAYWRDVMKPEETLIKN